MPSSRRCLRLVPRPASRHPIGSLCFLVLTLGACAAELDPGNSLANSTTALTDGESHDGHPAVGLLEVKQEGSSKVEYCTATLVGRLTVLTAAHCLADQQQHTFWLVERAYGAAELIVHGGWDASNPDYPDDIGLIVLSEAPPITPIALSPAAPAVGLPVTLVGFGTTGDGRTDHGIKRIGTNVIDRFDEKRFIFSGTGSGEANTCEGDSGGPVLAQLAGQEVLLGVNSAGVPPCGTTAITTRIDAYLPWIRYWSNGDLVEATGLAPDAACQQLGTCSDDDSHGGCAIGGPQQPTAGDLPLVLLAILLVARRTPFACIRRPRRSLRQ